MFVTPGTFPRRAPGAQPLSVIKGRARDRSLRGDLTSPHYDLLGIAVLASVHALAALHPGDRRAKMQGLQVGESSSFSGIGVVLGLQQSRRGTGESVTNPAQESAGCVPGVYFRRPWNACKNELLNPFQALTSMLSREGVYIPAFH